MLGYTLADTLHTDVVASALRLAVTFREAHTGPAARVAFHANRDCQCTSTSPPTWQPSRTCGSLSPDRRVLNPGDHRRQRLDRRGLPPSTP